MMSKTMTSRQAAQALMKLNKLNHESVLKIGFSQDPHNSDYFTQVLPCGLKLYLTYHPDSNWELSSRLWFGSEFTRFSTLLVTYLSFDDDLEMLRSVVARMKLIAMQNDD
jgi:hypothetical protein